jgi:hypothetical protein
VKKKASITPRKNGAEEGTRTPTGFLPQPPQGCVSTSFTTSAYFADIVTKNNPMRNVKVKNQQPFFKQFLPYRVKVWKTKIKRP